MSKAYAARVRELIEEGEGLRYEAYPDTNNIPTVGYGFNLRDPLVSRLLTDEIGEEKYKELVADAHRDEKKVRLSDETVERVYSGILSEKDKIVDQWYGGVNLNTEQRAVITDLVWNGGSKLAGPETNFFKAVHRGDWDTAVHEVRNRSNPNNVTGIQNRRNRQARALANASDASGIKKKTLAPLEADWRAGIQADAGWDAGEDIYLSRPDPLPPTQITPGIRPALYAQPGKNILFDALIQGNLDKALSPLQPKADFDAVDYSRPSTFGQNFKNEWKLSPQMDFWRWAVDKPNFPTDADWVNNKRVFEPENIRGYENHANEAAMSRSADEWEWIKSVLVEKDQARQALHNTGAWASSLSVGLLHPLNLVPLAHVRGVGLLRGMMRGGGSVGTLIGAEEAARQAYGIDVPIEESAMAVGTGFLIGGTIGSLMGRFGGRAEIDRISASMDEGLHALDQASASPRHLPAEPAQLNVPVMVQQGRLFFDDTLLETEFQGRVWNNIDEWSTGGTGTVGIRANFMNVDEWKQFRFEHAHQKAENPKRGGESDLEYQQRINRLAVKGFNETKLGRTPFNTGSVFSLDQTDPHAPGAFNVKGKVYTRMNSWMKMLQRVDEHFMGDNFLAQHAWAWSHGGVMHRGAGLGVPVPQSIESATIQRWEPLQAETFGALETLWMRSLGVESQVGTYSGVNWSAKGMAAGDALRLNNAEGRLTKEEFLLEASLTAINPSRTTDINLQEAAKVINRFFREYEEAGNELRIWGKSPDDYQRLMDETDVTIRDLEKRLDELIDEKYLAKDKAFKIIMDLERKAREGMNLGLTQKQFKYLNDLIDQVENERSSARGSYKSVIDTVLKDLNQHRRDRLFFEQRRDGLRKFGQGKHKESYYSRIWRNDLDDDEREALIQIFVDYYKANPDQMIKDPKLGWIRIADDPGDVGARAQRTVDAIIQDARAGNMEGTQPMASLGLGTQYVHTRVIDIPNEKLIEHTLPDGRVINFIEVDPNVVLRRYTSKMGPQLETARVFGDRLALNRIADIRTHIHKNYIMPLLKAGPPTRKTRMQIDRIRMEEERYLEDFYDLRDHVLHQFSNIEVTKLSRAVEAMKNYTGLTFMGSVIKAATIDAVRPGMILGYKSFLEVLPDALVNFRQYKVYSEELREVTGELMQYVNSTTARRFTEILDNEGAGRYTKLERGLQRVQGPFYIANGLTPWTHWWSTLTGGMAGHLIIKHSDELVAGKLTKVGRQRLDMMGISDEAARKIAQMPTQKSATGRLLMLNTAEWTDIELVNLVGRAINQEIRRTLTIPNASQRPNLMSGVFRVRNKTMQKALESEWGKRLGIQRGAGDRFAQPALSLPFQFLSWPIAALQTVTIEGMQRRDVNALMGFMAMMSMGYFAGYLKTPNWSELTIEEQAVRAFELSGVAAIVGDLPLMAEEIGEPFGLHVGIRRAMGHDPMFERDATDIAGRVGGASIGLFSGLAASGYQFFFDPNTKSSAIGSQVRRSILFNNIFWLNNGVFAPFRAGQREILNPVIEALRQ